MIKFLLQAVVLCAVAVVCIAYTRRGHKVGEASFDVDYRSVFEQPHLIKKVEKATYLTVKKDVKEKVGRAKVRELKIPKGDMKKNKDEVEVNEDELKWNEQEFPSLDVTSIGASMASLRRFLHHARRVRTPQVCPAPLTLTRYFISFTELAAKVCPLIAFTSDFTPVSCESPGSAIQLRGRRCASSSGGVQRSWCGRL
ncbi:hypothetical protein E2C01_076029 [Portunus trituberculatus]|uniref:Uncharacterized protein n=1 Tax=Portunus trituberculatus TaxID=210409 RepID=A0A5B7IM64_PORTR|nr:hypothetical protein [Portunus trituberculatus]